LAGTLLWWLRLAVVGHLDHSGQVHMRGLTDVRLSPQRSAAPEIVGSSAALIRLMTMARRVAAGNAKVLITGESGVGKDVVARVIHASSSRAHCGYIALNCASFSDALLESELFGHSKGSFTGAYRDKVGKLELAHRGTIFLDEIGEMSLRMQAMLLRFLENGEIQPVGSDAAPQRVDVRVIAATNRDLPAMVTKGEFREDLLYRIRVAHLHVAPLRERREDIRPLIAHVVHRSGQSAVLSEPTLAALEAYHWPGNIRELQNVVEQMLAMADGPAIGVEQLPPAISCAPTASLARGRDRRHRVADALFEKLTTGQLAFWEHVYPLFMNRDLTRADLRQLVGRGLTASGGHYRGLLRLFGIPDQEYKRFLNFLASHECTVDFREYRPSTRSAPSAPPCEVLKPAAYARYPVPLATDALESGRGAPGAP
jgi:DNA-binding NtrC family response regulator